MSRFRQPERAVRTAPVALAVPKPPVSVRPPDRISVVPRAEPKPSPLQWLAFIAVCIYLFSVASYLNEMGLLYLGVKTYLSTIFGPAAVLAGVLSGHMLRGARTNIGKFWIAFFVWLVIDIPFSSWKGGSFQHVILYYLPGYLMFFVLCASAVTWKQIRVVLYVLGAASLMVLFYCMTVGRAGETRFQLPDGSLANSNDLAFCLVVSLPILLFLFSRPGIAFKLIGITAAAFSVLYILKTGSRGSFLTVVVLCLVMCCVLPLAVRIRLGVLAAILGVLTFLFVPAATRQRLIAVSVTDDAPEFGNGSDYGSQVQREELFTTSLKFTLTHPLFGVGPGQFANFLFSDSGKRGEWAATLGTHNAYTQVSSECGIPGFIFYTAVIFLSIGSNFRVYKAARKIPALKPVADLAFCLFMIMLAYALNTVFAHLAYTHHLPAFAGLSAALKLAADPLLSNRQAA